MLHALPLRPHRKLRREVQAQDRSPLDHAALDDIAREVRDAAAARDAVKLLVGVVPVLGTDARDPCGFCFRRPVPARDQKDPACEPVSDSIAERVAMQRVRRLAGADVLDQLVERVVDAVVRRDDGDARAPDEQRHAGFEQTVRVVVEGELVEDEKPMLEPAEVARGAGQTDEPATVREGDAKRLDAAARLARLLVKIIEEKDLHLACRHAEMHRPLAGLAHELFCQVFLVADVVAVQRVGHAVHHALGTRRPGDTDLTRLLADLDLRRITEELLLVRQEQRLVVEGNGLTRHRASPRRAAAP